MLSMQYLQLIVTIFVAGEITFRLSKDIYKTREKQKTREGLVKLNWTSPNVANEILQTKFPIKSIGSIIATIILCIILSGIILKNFSI